jgi:monothiol glutaredoxin
MSRDVQNEIDQLVKGHPVVLFMKGTPSFPMCGFSAQTASIVQACGVEFESVNVLADPEIREGIKTYGNWPTIPQLYVNGQLVGGCDITRELYQRGELEPMLRQAGGADSKPA